MKEVLEQREVEHRGARAALDQHPDRQQHGRRCQADDHDRVVPATEPAARDPQHQAGEAEDESDVAEDVIATHLIWSDELAQDQRAPGGSGQREGHVEPEHPMPGDRHQGAAEYRADRQPDRGDHRVGAHREAEFLLGEGVGDKGGGVGEQERRADSLQDSPEDQHGRAGGEAGSERGEREQQETTHVGALAPEQIAQPARHQHKHGGRDQVGEDRAGERPPLVVLVAGSDAEARSWGN